MNSLIRIENLFVQFFSLAQTRIADTHFPFRLARNSNQGTRQVRNSDWLPHVEHQRVTTVANRKCLQYQRNRFPCGHEKPFNLRMRNAERLIPAKLFLE